LLTSEYPWSGSNASDLLD
jgi:Ca2+-binding EF-hand superfamily protein